MNNDGFANGTILGFAAFVMDDFARRHLREWFAAGCAPYGWDLGDLDEFEAWIDANADDLPEYASWPDLVRWFESVAA